MTTEEAIRILDPETTVEALAEIEYYAGFSGKTAKIQAVSRACELAVAALRAQQKQNNACETSEIGMTLQRAIRLASQWASGGVCSVRDEEAREYHKMALAAFLAQLKYKDKEN